MAPLNLTPYRLNAHSQERSRFGNSVRLAVGQYRGIILAFRWRVLTTHILDLTVNLENGQEDSLILTAHYKSTFYLKLFIDGCQIMKNSRWPALILALMAFFSLCSNAQNQNHVKAGAGRLIFPRFAPWCGMWRSASIYPRFAAHGISPKAVPRAKPPFVGYSVGFFTGYSLLESRKGTAHPR
jgi:hypothetical protein